MDGHFVDPALFQAGISVEVVPAGHEPGVLTPTVRVTTSSGEWAPFNTDLARRLARSLLSAADRADEAGEAG